MLLEGVVWAAGDEQSKDKGKGLVGQAPGAEVQSYADRWGVVPESMNSPTVDGNLESIWESAFQADGFLTMFDNQPAASDTEISLLHDEDNLYIGLKGHKDQTAPAPETEKVEVLLAPGRVTDAVYRLNIPIVSGSRTISTNWGGVTTDLTGAEVQVIQGSDSWTLEARIPIASLGVDAVTAGDQWMFNVLRYYGINSQPFSSWVPIRDSYISDQGGTSYSLVSHVVNQARMAPIYFSSLPALSGVDGSRANAWSPSNWSLVYQDYQTKQFRMKGSAIHSGTEIQLSWVSPDGVSTKLEEPAIEKQDQDTVVTFSHPKPLARGLYRLQAGFRQGNGVYQYFELSFDRDSLIAAGDSLSMDAPPAEQKQPVTSAPASQQVQNVMQLIPENTGFIFTGLPENPGLRPYQLYNWSVNNPDQIVSKTTGTVYPNAAYPETQKLTVTNPLGETVDYPYYEDEEGRKYFISAHVWYFQKDYALRETGKLAATDPLGAARLLNRWADVYAGYMPTNDYYWTNYPLISGPPYHYWGGVWYRWYTGEMTNMSYLINAYRDVRKTNAFELLSQEIGEDVEKKLVDKVFKPSFDFVRSFPVLNHNMEYTTWLGLIRMAKASGVSSYMHEAVDLMQDFAANNFLSDGFWKEVTLSYHNQSTNGLLQSMNEAKGWSDPAGYVSPRNGQRLDNLDMQGTYPALNNAQTMKDVVAYPNGSYVPVMDTWANEKTNAPRTDLGSYLLPFSGISRLTQGAGSTQQQMYLNFVPKYGHNQFDPLNLTLFAKGQELLPDIGYTHTFFRKWTVSTMAHNTVVVDGQDMTLDGEGKHGGQIQSFIKSDDGVQIVKASQESAYPVTDEYSREPWMIGFGNEADASDGYVVDIFRVSGGNRHEYTLGGDANRDGEFITDLPMQPYGDYLLPEGTDVIMPESENDAGSAEGHYYGYIYVQDVKRAEIPDDTYKITLETEENGTEKAKLSITGFVDAGAGNELFIGKSPSLRATRLSGTANDINTEAVKYWMPKLVVRRSGTDLSSTFINVMEAYTGSGPKIEAVEKLTPEQAVEGDVALQIRYGTTTDIILSSANPDRTLKVGDMELVGKYGMIRMENGIVTKMMLSEGSLLRKGNQTVVGEGTITGTITDVLRKLDGDAVDALVTQTTVPADLVGRTVVVDHPDGKTHGYTIQEIRQDGGNTLIVLNNMDPGWEILSDGSSRMTAYPSIGWNGAHTFRIGNVNAN
jgi:hypothetical protein